MFSKICLLGTLDTSENESYLLKINLLKNFMENKFNVSVMNIYFFFNIETISMKKIKVKKKLFNAALLMKKLYILNNKK